MIFTMAALLISIFEQETLINTSIRMRNNSLLEKASGVSVLVVMEHQNLTDAEQEQLHKIMQACRLEEGAYVICDTTATWLDFRMEEHLQTVILFGDLEQRFNINILIPIHQPVTFDGRNWIKTCPVSELMNNAQLKSAFWQQALKPIFVP
jgi:DNA polymerase III psi subunit